MAMTPEHQETASVERKKVGMLIPPPVLLIAAVVLSVAAHRLWFGPFTFSLPRTALGLAIILASFVLVAWCVRLFKKAGTPYRPVSPATTIVSSGPYRLSRNPIYVGMGGLLIGLGILLGSYVFAVAVVLFIAVVHVGVVLPEERYLQSLHGDTYRQYMHSVRRWL